jgi:conjugal transfer pilus assembly protein TraV
MSLRGVLVGVACAALLAGCAASGLDAKSSFACKAPDGVTCMSVSGVYEASRQNALPAQTPPTPAAPAGARPAGVSAVAPATANASSATGARRAPLTSGTPLRSAPRILRIWVAPYEDSEGDLRDQAHIYVAIDHGRWQIEHMRRAIQDRFAPIRAVAPAASPAASGSANTGGAGPQPARSPEIVPTPGAADLGGTPAGVR